MQNEKTYFNSVAILFIVVAVVAWFVWQSWYLYYAAVIAGYVALMLLTVILKSKMGYITAKCPEQYPRHLAKLYGIALDNFAIICLSSLFASLVITKNAGLSVLMIFANVAIAIAAFILTMRCCEKSDWRQYFNKAMFD